MKPATVARRDAILCAVRDGILVTTDEVVTRIGACPSDYGRVYADLRALDRAGLVHWHRAGGDYPNATWILSTSAREQFVTADLEDMWVAESAPEADNG